MRIDRSALGRHPELYLKPLFILGRLRRNASTLEAELDAFDSSLGLSEDASVILGDLAFWIFAGQYKSYRIHDHTPGSFYDLHKGAIESGLLSEFVVGELGRTVYGASESRHVDRFREETFMYGAADEKNAAEAAQAGEPEWYADEERDPYEDRLFWTVGLRQWLDRRTSTHEVPSFGGKLIILAGRDPERPFIGSQAGQQLKEKLGRNTRVIVNAQGANACAIAFENEASCSDLFRQIKRGLPPRLVEDFAIVDLGQEYCTGEQPISLYADWAERRSYTKSRPRQRERQGRTVTVEVKQRRVPASDRKAS